MNTMTKNTAQELRQQAAELDKRAAESFERCDTDGFVSQWADGMCAQELRLAARIAEQGGKALFRGLFDAKTGERVKAKIVTVDDRFRGYGTVEKWMLLDENDRATDWIAAGKKGPRAKLTLRGLVEREEWAPAKAELAGSGRGLAGALTVHAVSKRTDGGYPADARTLAQIRKGA